MSTTRPAPCPPDVDLVAVFDMGKTHTKLSIADARSGQLLSQARRANRRVERGGWKQLDLAAAQQWLVGELAASPHRDRIGLLVPVAHGAACVLVDRRGEVLIAPDYEDTAFDTLGSDYDRQRDAFAETCSPRLPAGLNLGAQLHALEHAEPGLWAATWQILLLPQYWSWRWCGQAASEVSSLGSHTDLWQPAAASYSTLAQRRRWSSRFPPLRAAAQMLDRIGAAMVRATGLPPECHVLCGLHDSNAAWLAQLAQPGSDGDLCLVSTGTWMVAMSRGAALTRLREDRDMLANVDVTGQPVPTARFMGGREFAALCGAEPATAAAADLRAVLAQRAMALPSFTTAGGPFGRRPGRRVGLDRLTPSQRRAAATLYVALATEVMLELLGAAAGPIVIDGPLAADDLYAAVLQALRPTQPVRCAVGIDGVVAGALALLQPAAGRHAPWAPAPIVDAPGLAEYRGAWRTAVAQADPGLGLRG